MKIEEYTERPFVIRPYGKKELACLYMPDNTLSTATKKFNDWLKRSPKLMKELEGTGITIFSRSYTTRQVKIIIRYLGEP